MLKPTYMWAPWMGPQSWRNQTMLNTEYKKSASVKKPKGVIETSEEEILDILYNKNVSCTITVFLEQYIGP